MEPSTTCTAPLRALLSEAASLRLRGDHGAAEIVEADALRALRAAPTPERAEARQ
ncbi:hypothetical protein J5Y09_19965 [Roseomonas sp. PWR1]|uniref:Uncharacterized protein n=1 Tax=Roseomonas nitratireducens TaxID=2820810 RepID=A0ABS4AZG6_9PROT|nr:hypothetical protein [Neoroseomonas nitratireducens]MBP0466213.1 hypothetical protein [Neoroseomonas nitratireducens]